MEDPPAGSGVSHLLLLGQPSDTTSEHCHLRLPPSVFSGPGVSSVSHMWRKSRGCLCPAFFYSLPPFTYDLFIEHLLCRCAALSTPKPVRMPRGVAPVWHGEVTRLGISTALRWRCDPLVFSLLAVLKGFGLEDS